MSARSGPTPRSWVGDSPFPWPSFRSVADGDLLRACFYVVEYQADTTRSGQAYLRLRLADRHGLLEGMVWEEVERYAPHVRQGGYVGVSGRVGSYNGRKQIRIDVLAALRVAPEDTEFFLPRGDRDPHEMERELAAVVGSVSDPGLRAVLERALDPATPLGRLFRRAPAAKRNHHAHVGGLLEHTLSVAGACDRLARHYGADVDRDLLVAGALLHDIGKTREIELSPGLPYTDEGRLLGHIVLGLTDVERVARAVPALSEGRRTLLLHLIASHQGRYEWQSPREPLTLEALLLHYADDMDAKVAQVRGRLADAPHGGWSGYDRSLGREFLRHGAEAGGAPEAARATPGAGLGAPRAAAPFGPDSVPRTRPADATRQAATSREHPAGETASSSAPIGDAPASDADPPDGDALDGDASDATSAPSLFDRL